jgi:hypothetical protein
MFDKNSEGHKYGMKFENPDFKPKFCPANP